MTTADLKALLYGLVFQISLLLMLAWGALAFGAEYAWAYAPLLVFSVVPSILGLREKDGALPSLGLRLSLSALFLAVVVQVLVPSTVIPTGAQTGAAGVEFNELYARATMSTPGPDATVARLSIAPARTLLGLAFLAAFSVLFAGSTRAVSARGPSQLVRGIVVLGVIVALVGLIQSAVRTYTLYGFWRTPKNEARFAPFINENHFAGWMAMVMALAIGAFGGSVARVPTRVKEWRDRLLWLSGSRGSTMILTAFSVIIMALATVVASSRGGLVGLFILFLAGSWHLMRRQSGRRRLISVTCLMGILLLVAIWGDAGRTIGEFSGAFETLAARKPYWLDTLRIIRDFPITGTGLNTYGIAMLHYQSPSTSSFSLIEAHNDYLQLAAEGGLLLGIPIIIALGALVREIRLRFTEAADDAETYWIRVGAATGLCAIGALEVFDFTLQMPGAAAMFVVLCAIAIHKPNHLKARA